MQPVVKAVLLSWSIPPTATFAIVLIALTYLRGVWLLRRAGYPNLPAWRIVSFLLGLFALFFALASPLDTFSSFVLTAHMLQHMTLMMVAPPLLLLGEPLIPFVRGMPRFSAREFAGPFLNWRVAGRIGLFLTRSVTALILMGTVMFIWHVPGPYELAVRSSAWHWFEHSCFFFVSVIFWWPVVQPWPSLAQWPRWAMVPYLIIADLQNTVLSAVLVFSDRVLYPSYATGPRLFGFPPQEDQAAAGAIMWVVGSVAFLVPAALIAIQCLSRKRSDLAITRAVPKHQATGWWSFLISKSRFSSPQFQALSFIVLFVAVSAGFLLLSHSASDDDDQVFLASQESGPFVVALYGPEIELSSAPASVSIGIQDRTTHQLVLNADVRISVRASLDESVQSAPIGSENKLLYGADVSLDTEGPHLLQVAVRNGSDHAVVSFPITVTKPNPETSFPWSYALLAAFAALLACVYIARHRPAHRRARQSSRHESATRTG